MVWNGQAWKDFERLKKRIGQDLTVDPGRCPLEFEGILKRRGGGKGDNPSIIETTGSSVRENNFYKCYLKLGKKTIGYSTQMIF